MSYDITIFVMTYFILLYPSLIIYITYLYHNSLLAGLGFDDFLESLESALSLLLKPIRVFVPFDKVMVIQCYVMLYHIFCFHSFTALILIHRLHTILHSLIDLINTPSNLPPPIFPYS